MRKFISLLALSLIILGSRISFAEFVSSSGVECAVKSHYGWAVRYDSNYLQNYSPTMDITVDCPLNLGARSTTSNSQTVVIVRYADYNSGSSLSCQVNKMTAGLQRTDGQYMYSCAQPGGCPSDTDRGFTGIGSYLVLTAPSTISIDDSITVHCSIPHGQNGLYSGIISYSAQ